MIILKNITLRNFLSIGAVCQAVNFDNKELTLILGENLDLGGDGARNGTGKTSLIQGLSYVLYGTPINQIRKDNLINRTNGKNMLVTLEFSVNGVDYKIERGRKPNILKFYVNNNLQSSKDENNESQGENKETQAVIESIIGMSSDMFKHIVALNTYSEPFLAMRTGDQRNIIEQLLGITLLSEKADLVKEKIRINKENIQQEEFKIKAIEEANKRVQTQIDSLKRRQSLWKKQHEESLDKLVIDYQELSKIDIEAELQAHKDLKNWLNNKKLKDSYDSLKARQVAWHQKRDKDVETLKSLLNNLTHIDIDKELNSHRELAVWNSKKTQLDALSVTKSSLLTIISKDEKLIEKLDKEIKTLEDNKCYACGQDFHDENHTKVLAEKTSMLSEAQANLSQTQTELKKIIENIETLGLGEKPTTYYKTEVEAFRHSSEVQRIADQIQDKINEADPYSEQLEEQKVVEVLGPRPNTHYETEAEAIEHRTVVSNLENNIAIKINEKDPYVEQISDMENQAIQEISFEKINEFTKIGEHLKFLLDVLTNKDSFVRKKILDQNLSYLNGRLTHYLDSLGLPHTVVFKNDLNVEITELGRDLDFDNLSRGERNRLILGLSFAFRDVWENLYHPINTLFIDELIDSGMDSAGVENSMAVLKDMSRSRGKSIWLVSHKEELSGRVPSILRVVKEGGFTTYNTSTDATT